MCGVCTGEHNTIQDISSSPEALLSGLSWSLPLPHPCPDLSKSPVEFSSTSLSNAHAFRCLRLLTSCLTAESHSASSFSPPITPRCLQSDILARHILTCLSLKGFPLSGDPHAQLPKLPRSCSTSEPQPPSILPHCWMLTYRHTVILMKSQGTTWLWAKGQSRTYRD